MSEDSRDPRVRLGQVFDSGSWSVCNGADDASGVLTGRGRIAGVPALAYCTDARTVGGTMGLEGCRHIVDAIDAATRERCPVVGLWHSGGARINEGVTALDGVGHVFEAMTRASGRVPQLSVVLGPAAGGAAYGPALTDVVVMAEEGRIFVTGPDVVHSVTGERIDMEGLGGPRVHTRKSGVVHVAARDEADAYRHARHLVGLLGGQGEFDLDAVRGGQDLLALLPRDPRLAYDVKPLVRTILDAGPDGLGTFEELQAKWAPNMLTGLGRLGRRTVGVVANNPIFQGGRLDSAAATKAARFVRMCASFGIPLVVVAEVAADSPGADSDSAVWHGAKLVHAFANAGVPRVTLMPRRAYGEGYVAMNSRSLGATAVFTWAGAEVALLPARPSVRALHQDKLAAVSVAERTVLFTELVAQHQRVEGGVTRALALGMVDDVIEPWETGLRIASALATAPTGPVSHRNIPL
jgi:acetyl-CoA/propionyl-CoA carboxylase carboxyl transferase subunit